MIDNEVEIRDDADKCVRIYEWVASGERMTLSLPVHPTKFGSAKVQVNGAEIPSGRVWDTIKAAMREGRKVDPVELAHVATTARIYIMEPRPLLLHVPKDEVPRAAELLVDSELPGFGVFLIEELMRPRPLLDEHNLLLGTCRTGETPETVMELIEGALLLGKHPVASVDGRYFFHEEPDRLHEHFGTNGDWLRLGVYFKRPGIHALNIPARGVDLELQSGEPIGRECGKETRPVNTAMAEAFANTQQTS